MISVYFDGAIMPRNPGGIPTWGIAALDEQNEEVLHLGNGMAEGARTNNVAEYAGIINAFLWVKGQEPGIYEVCGDSQLILRQTGGQYGCNSDVLKDLCKRAKELFTYLNSNGFTVTLKWVPREENKMADRQSRLAYYTAIGVPPPKEKRCPSR